MLAHISLPVIGFWELLRFWINFLFFSFSFFYNQHYSFWVKDASISRLTTDLNLELSFSYSSCHTVVSWQNDTEWEINETEVGNEMEIFIIYTRRCPWCNGYRRRNWTRRHEFKSWTRLIAFHIALIPLGKVWMQLFSLQLWVNSRAD